MKRLLSTETLATLCLLLAIVVASAGFGAHAQTRTQYAGQPVVLAGTALQAFSHQNLGDLKPGETAVSRFDYDAKALLPVALSEAWPTRFTSGVRGWSSVQWNRYYGMGTTPSAPVAPVRIADIKTLTLDYVIEGDGDANVGLVDWFVTKTPNGVPGPTETIAEFEVIAHPSKSALAWARQGLPVGVVGPWTATRWPNGSANVFVFVPTNGKRLSGQIDLRATMLWTAEKTRLLTGQEWVNGLGLGLEAVSGKSTMTIRDMRVTYARK